VLSRRSGPALTQIGTTDQETFRVPRKGTACPALVAGIWPPFSYRHGVPGRHRKSKSSSSLYRWGFSRSNLHLREFARMYSRVQFNSFSFLITRS